MIVYVCVSASARAYVSLCVSVYAWCESNWNTALIIDLPAAFNKFTDFFV